MPRALLSLVLLFSACGEEEPASFAPPPTYQTLRHPDFKGAFFQFEHEGDPYLACSLHQAHLKPGSELFRDGDDDPVVLKKRVHTQKDLQVWTFDGPTKPGHLLTYRSDLRVKKDDRIYFLHRGEKIAATVVALPDDNQFRHQYQSDRPFAAAGLSGSPVYLPRSGVVIGVLQTADDKERATRGGFEVLALE